ncbi:MAG: DNA (cytosine-5-)-methyltransferase [Rhodocyclaceae bacterium]|nr:DNA (cytosine-5-)-methyltransferase [Rhodocyclaceae bacterium]
MAACATAATDESSTPTTLRFIDLFAGLGGTRLGFEQACAEQKLRSQCVFTSEIKEFAVDVYKNNFADSDIHGDITQIVPSSIPAFDYLLAGFPCQPFSSAGKRNGFLDDCGGLFFTIHQILKIKKPQGFLLENVDGLATHDQGNTLKVILAKLHELKYKVSWQVLDASEFGVPQKRKRIYIVGHKAHTPDLKNFKPRFKSVASSIERDKPVKHTAFTKLLSEKFTPEQLIGKSIKDKRGGNNNIHSWDLEVKGKVNSEQKKILGLILTKRRSKAWAADKGIDWMDGMPLTLTEIQTFYTHPNLEANLEDLSKKGYLKFEHPKKKVITDGIAKRVAHTGAPKGFNIVAGKLSFPLAKILDPKDVAPTLVATEAGKTGVCTKNGVRRITVREGLRFSGFPDSYQLGDDDYQKAFDLIGNTVMPPVIKAVALRLIKSKL